MRLKDQCQKNRNNNKMVSTESQKMSVPFECLTKTSL